MATPDISAKSGKLGALSERAAAEEKAAAFMAKAPIEEQITELRRRRGL